MSTCVGAQGAARAQRYITWNLPGCNVHQSNSIFRELIPRSITSNSSSSESDWLDRAAITYGGTFLEGEVNEVRCLWKIVVFSILLIPYWMIYAQVNCILLYIVLLSF